MATPEKPSRLGRGLDALLARRETPKPAAPQATATPPHSLTPDTTGSPVPSGGLGPNDNAPRLISTKNAEDGGRSLVTSAGMASPQSISTAAVPPSPHAPPASRDARADQPITDLSRPATDTKGAGPGVHGVDGHAPGYRPLPIAHIAPNPFQPRKEFHPQELADLESSLRSQGLMQPITVRPSPHHAGFELIAGERRLRAATRLGWQEIPAIVRETDDRTMLTLAMVENLQRSDLDPIEEADGYQRLIDDFDATQQEVAEVVGKERSTVANALRLLALPASVKRLLQERKLTVGHARALLPLAEERAMAELARDIVAKSLSVRDVERRVRSTRPSPAKSGRKAKPANTGIDAGSPADNAELRRVEELLRKKMQTTVNIHLTAKERGEIRVSFFSNDDLERVLELLGVRLDS